MTDRTEELYSLLVPLNECRLIVPRSCIAEVIRFSLTAEEAGDDAPNWFRGYAAWNGQQVPVISFEELSGLNAATPGGRTRVAIFNSLGGAAEAGAFGMLTEGFPQLVRVNRTVMEPHDDHDWPEDGPIICQIRMINEYPLIPDLEHVEAKLAELLSTASA